MGVALNALVLAFAVAQLPDAIRCPKVKGVLESIALRNCSDSPPVRNYFHNASIVQERKDLNYGRGDLKIEEPGNNHMKWVVLAYKCTQRDAVIDEEGCEFFMKLERKNMCADIKMENQLWSHFLDSSEPPFLCPFQKGIYKFSKMTANVEQVNQFLAGVPFLQNFYWVGRVRVYKGKKIWSCLEYVVKIGTVRV